MKKLTAGIFTVLLGLVTVNAADAAVASKGYVIQEVKKVTDTIGTVAEGKTVVGLIEEAKSAASTDASEALDEYSEATDKKIADMDAAYKQADTNIGTRIDGVESAYAAADQAISATVAANKKAADEGLALKEDKSNKVEAITEANKADATKYTSVKAVVEHVNTVKSELSNGANGLDVRLTEAEGDITTLFNEKADTATVESDLATAKSELTTAIATAKSEAAADATTKADAAKAGAEKTASDALAAAVATLEGKITEAGTGASDDLAAAKTELEGKITTAQNAADAAQGEVDALEGVVATNKQEASTAATNAETNAKAYALEKANAAMDASVKYTDDVVSGLKLADIARVPAACSNEANYCALTTNGTNFIWEVIERASGEPLGGTPVTVPDTVAATKPTALTE